MAVYFVDTSVLCNLLPVPGRDQHRSEVIEDLKARQVSNTLILPVASIVETGNFIAQISDGRLRRETAERFKRTLELVCENKAPWQLHLHAWNSEFLTMFIAGANTGMDLVQHAVNRLGAGDLSILAERAAYAKRAEIGDVRIWTRDAQLSAYEWPEHWT